MNIVISPYRQKDAPELYALVICSKEHLQPWMPWLHSKYSIGDAQAWVDLCIHDWEVGRAYRYLIRSAGGELLGAVGLERVDTAHKVCELGYWVGSSLLSGGIATYASRLAAREAFDRHGLMRIQINILTDNMPSNRVAQKLGATFEGTLRNRLYHNGQSKPANTYSLIPNDLT